MDIYVSAKLYPAFQRCYLGGENLPVLSLVKKMSLTFTPELFFVITQNCLPLPGNIHCSIDSVRTRADGMLSVSLSGDMIIFDDPDGSLQEAFLQAERAAFRHLLSAGWKLITENLVHYGIDIEEIIDEMKPVSLPDEEATRV